jgi:hypothetical protein
LTLFPDLDNDGREVTRSDQKKVGATPAEVGTRGKFGPHRGRLAAVVEVLVGRRRCRDELHLYMRVVLR